MAAATAAVLGATALAGTIANTISSAKQAKQAKKDAQRAADEQAAAAARSETDYVNQLGRVRREREAQARIRYAGINNPLSPAGGRKLKETVLTSPLGLYAPNPSVAGKTLLGS